MTHLSSKGLLLSVLLLLAAVADCLRWNSPKRGTTGSPPERPRWAELQRTAAGLCDGIRSQALQARVGVATQGTAFCNAVRHGAARGLAGQCSERKGPPTDRPTFFDFCGQQPHPCDRREVRVRVWGWN
ncbi:unnamed protein product, partial [Discosporangium mesarthrocarpum]